MTTHTTKLGLRYAIDTSPEPVSNSVMSVGELGLIAAVGMGLRIVYVENATGLLAGDGLYYHAIAALVADGKGFIAPKPYLATGQIIASGYASHIAAVNSSRLRGGSASCVGGVSRWGR